MDNPRVLATFLLLSLAGCVHGPHDGSCAPSSSCNGVSYAACTSDGKTSCWIKLDGDQFLDCDGCNCRQAMTTIGAFCANNITTLTPTDSCATNACFSGSDCVSGQVCSRGVDGQWCRTPGCAGPGQACAGSQECSDGQVCGPLECTSGPDAYPVVEVTKISSQFLPATPPTPVRVYADPSAQTSQTQISWSIYWVHPAPPKLAITVWCPTGFSPFTPTAGIATSADPYTSVIRDDPAATTRDGVGVFGFYCSAPGIVVKTTIDGQPSPQLSSRRPVFPFNGQAPFEAIDDNPVYLKPLTY